MLTEIYLLSKRGSLDALYVRGLSPRDRKTLFKILQDDLREEEARLRAMNGQVARR
jgi:hypothetical protein